MKPLEPIRHEPPPPEAALWKVALALALMVIGIAAALYCFHESGAIGNEALLTAMILVTAVSTGVILAFDMEREVRRHGSAGSSEGSPSFDIYAVWPPPDGGRRKAPTSGKADARHARLRPARRKTDRDRKQRQ